jgi:hypothetical protein
VTLLKIISYGEFLMATTQQISLINALRVAELLVGRPVVVTRLVALGRLKIVLGMGLLVIYISSPASPVRH